MPLSRVEIANLALDELPSREISSFEDESLQAQVCDRHYQQALDELLENPWNFARTRVTLVATTNTRSDAWPYAWAMPSNVAFPLGVEIIPTAQAGSVYLDPAEPVSVVGDIEGRALSYDFEGGKLYTRSSTARLVYIQTGPEIETFTAQFRRALVVLLASRIVMPILKDPQRKRELIQEAEVARDRALAADRNRTRQTYGNFIPDAVAARLY